LEGEYTELNAKNKITTFGEIAVPVLIRLSNQIIEVNEDWKK
jgi:hypothetical protein